MASTSQPSVVQSTTGTNTNMYPDMFTHLVDWANIENHSGIVYLRFDDKVSRGYTRVGDTLRKFTSGKFATGEDQKPLEPELVRSQPLCLDPGCQCITIHHALNSGPQVASMTCICNVPRPCMGHFSFSFLRNWEGQKKVVILKSEPPTCAITRVPISQQDAQGIRFGSDPRAPERGVVYLCKGLDIWKGTLRQDFAHDPLASCFMRQYTAVKDIVELLVASSFFPAPTLQLCPFHVEAGTLKRDTLCAINAVYSGPIPAFNGDPGLIFRFNTYDPILMDFIPSN